MSRPDRERLIDIAAACNAIANYLARADAGDDIVFDAIRVRLIEIGEAVKDIDPAVLAAEPSLQWAAISSMRDRLAHRYFDTSHAVVRTTARSDIPDLAAAVRRMLQSREAGSGPKD